MIIDRDTKVVVQGITGARGSLYVNQAMDYGTQVVAGVRPGRGGETHLGLPVFDRVEQAREATGADTSIVFVPGEFATSSMQEAADAGLRLSVCVTEGVPVHDVLRLRRHCETQATRLIGPNCPGVIVPGECMLGIMPPSIFRPGDVGIVARSGTLFYEAVAQLSGAGIGQSVCIGIGADPIPGTSLTEAVDLLLRDNVSRAILVIGEIGGSAEEFLAERLRKDPPDKPVVAYIAGRSAPPERRMGHAGAVVTRGLGRAEDKIKALTAAGVTVVTSAADIGSTVARICASQVGAPRDSPRTV